jgi:hypothetical protein
MRLLLIISLLVIVLLLTTKREPFTELFGFSGYKTPVKNVKFNDTKPDMTGYNQADADVNNDMMQEFVLKANQEITKRTGLCTYIIETTSVKRYINEQGKQLYECMFMTVKDSGFAFGFSVVASYEIVNGNISIVSLRSQPLDVQTVSNIKPFVDGAYGGKEFVKYELVKEAAVPTISELERAKNKLQ